MLGNQYELRVRLHKFAGLPRMVCVQREVAGEPRHLGFIMEVGREVVLVYQFADFHPDGITAFRIGDIEEVLRGPRERFWDRMLTTEGLMPCLTAPRGVDPSAMGALLKSLGALGKHVVVECEGADSVEDDTYSIGRVESVKGDTLSMHCFDCTCEWAPTPTAIELEKITRIQFDTPYINTMSRYLR